MDSNILTQFLTVSIEAFSALLGISAAYYIFILQTFSERIINVKTRKSSGLRHLSQITAQVDPEYNQVLFDKFQITDFSDLENDQDDFNSVMEDLADFYEELYEKTVITHRGQSTYGTDFILYWGSVDESFTELSYRIKSFEEIPKRYFFSLVLICGLPIFYSFFGLLLRSYDHNSWLIQSNILFGLDMLSLAWFFIFSFKMGKSIQ